MEVEDGSANMEVEDDDARLRAEVLAYMKANRVTRASLGASTEVDLREAAIRQWLKGTYKGNNAAVRDTHSLLAPFCLPPRPDREQRLLCV